MYKNVKYVLLDPSCSGSGIVGRLDHLLNELNDSSTAEEQEELDSSRLQSLAEFQKKAILHAFTFPNVKKVVYSTCSKHHDENEDVVKYILDYQKEFGLEKGVFPSWTRRGLPIIPEGAL